MVRKRLVLTSTSTVDVGKEMIDVLRTRVLRNVRRVLGLEIDREMTKLFRFLSSQMQGGSNFSILNPYLPRRWTKYTKDYSKKKTAQVGHLRWFNLTGELASELRGVSETRFLRGIGQTRVSITRDRSRIQARIAPKLVLRRNDLETDLYGRGLLSRSSWVKLLGKKNRYRALMGPAFQYFIQQRIPAVLRRVLRTQI